MKPRSIESQVIDFLRFPLIVGVVLIHARFFEVWSAGKVVNVERFRFAAEFMRFVTDDICSTLCVPMFFFISGYLFFRDSKYFSIDTYRQKIGKRVRTLLVPYLFWNAVVLAVYFLVQTVASGMVSGNNRPIADYSMTDFLWAFWNKDNVNGFTEIGAPIALQFWYIRDLMMVSVFSPVIYFCVKRFNVWALIVFEVFSQLNFLPDVVGLSSMAVFFFSFGAYFSIHNRSFISRSKCVNIGAVIVFIVTLVMLNEYSFGVMRGWVNLLNLLSGMLALFAVSAALMERKKVKKVKFLSDSSFMIFAVHALVLQVLQKSVLRMIGNPNDVKLIGVYLLVTVVAVAVSMGVYAVMRRWLPRFTAVITGGR